MKTLIVTRDFGTNFWIPGWMLRMVELSNYLSSHGHEVHVVAANRKQSWDNVTVDHRVQIHPVSFGSEDWVHEALKGWRRLSRKLVRAKDLLFHPMSKIDTTEPSIRRITRSVVRVIDRHSIDVVVISSPPHSLQRLVPILKSRYGKAIVVVSDFRDPWTTASRYRPDDDATLSKYQAIERHVAASADVYSTVTVGLADSLESVTGVRPTVIENGYSVFQAPRDDLPPDEELRRFVKRAHSEGRVVLGFFGSGKFSNSEVTGKNLAAVLDPVSDSDLFSGRVAFVFQGAIKVERSWPNHVPILVLPPQTNATVIANMRQIDVGVAVYTDPFDAPLVMGGKIYDYVYAGIPIWLISTSNATSQKRFVEQYPGTSLFSAVDQEGDVEAVLQRVVTDGELLKGSADISDLERFRYSRESQYDVMIAAIERCKKELMNA